MPDFIDMTGRRYGRLLVLQQAPKRRRKHHWQCRCDCNTIKVVAGNDLRSGATQSCGCLRDDVARATRSTHGHTRNGKFTRTYLSWDNMKSRTSNPNDKNWSNYGGRGITLCGRWHDFENFLVDMGACPPGLTLERIDTNGHYCKANCIWDTQKNQNNNRRDNFRVTIDGKTLTLAQWCERRGLNYDTVWSRVRRYGWDAERALSVPSLRPPVAITIDDETLTLKQWCERRNLRYNTVWSRIRARGWDAERALAVAFYDHGKLAKLLRGLQCMT